MVRSCAVVVVGVTTLPLVSRYTKSGLLAGVVTGGVRSGPPKFLVEFGVVVASCASVGNVKYVPEVEVGSHLFSMSWREELSENCTICGLTVVAPALVYEST